MSAAKNKGTTAQGSGSTDNQELFDHIVTQEDLDANPDLVTAEVKVGDVIQVPVKDEEPETSLSTQTPDWVGEILESNAKLLEANEALITSNDKILDALNALRDFDFDKVRTPSNSAEEVFTQEIDEDESYEVAEGKSFRDANDFSKEYKEGEDVSHLGAERLKSLLNQGLIVQS